MYLWEIQYYNFQNTVKTVVLTCERHEEKEREKKKIERGGGERKDEQIAWHVERKEF